MPVAALVLPRNSTVGCHSANQPISQSPNHPISDRVDLSGDTLDKRSGLSDTVLKHLVTSLAADCITLQKAGQIFSFL